MIFRNLEPQTIVPNIRLCPFFSDVVPWQVDFILLTFNAAARAWGRTTMAKTISNLRLYNAICINNIDFRSTTNHLKPRSRVEVSFWTFQVILISIEANNNLQICQKENFILILNHLSLSLSKFFNFYVQMCFDQTVPKKVWQSVKVVAWMTCRCWCGGAKCRSWSNIPVVPGWGSASWNHRCWLLRRGTPRIPNHQPKPPMNH